MTTSWGKWPYPCQDMFQEMAILDPDLLKRKLRDPELTPIARSWAAMAFGACEGSLDELLLLLVLDGEEAVQEGAVYGLESHINEVPKLQTILRLQHRIASDAVKDAIEEVLSNAAEKVSQN